MFMSGQAMRNGAGGESVRERVATQLQAAVDELNARRAVIADELAAVDVELKQLKKSLAPLLEDPAAAKRPGPKPKKSGGAHKQVSPERMATVLAAFDELAGPDGEVRAVDVERHTGINAASVSAATRQLRDREAIRLVRRVTGPGGGSYYRPTGHGAQV